MRKKRNKLSQWLRLAKKTLNDFLISKHEKILLNSNVGVFRSYFFLGRKQSEENFIMRFSKKLVDVYYFILFKRFEVFFCLRYIVNRKFIFLIYLLQKKTFSELLLKIFVSFAMNKNEQKRLK